jgi:hypothetical protein
MHVFLCSLLARLFLSTACTQLSTCANIDNLAEISKSVGTDTTARGIIFQVYDRIKPIASRQLEMLAAGQDPQDIDLGSVKGSKTGTGRFAPHESRSISDIDIFSETARIMGGDTTAKAITYQFWDRYGAIGDRQLEMLAAGDDPQHIDVNSVKGRVAASKAKKADTSRGLTILPFHLVSSTHFLLYTKPFTC